MTKLSRATFLVYSDALHCQLDLRLFIRFLGKLCRIYRLALAERGVLETVLRFLLEGAHIGVWASCFFLETGLREVGVVVLGTDTLGIPLGPCHDRVLETAYDEVSDLGLRTDANSLLRRPHRRVRWLD